MADERTTHDHDRIDDELARIETMLHDLSPDDLEPVDPPTDVWARIEAALGADRAATTPVISLDERRNRYRAPFLAAAAAVVLVVVGVTAIAMRGGGDDATVLASADLTFDPAAFDPLGEGAAATARLVERDGSFEIVIDDAVLPNVPEGADLELWLIETDAAGTIVDVAPVSLIDGAGSYTVPSDLDVDTHRIVDISIEPRDGDAAHSGRSILRGALPTA